MTKSQNICQTRRNWEYIQIDNVYYLHFSILSFFASDQYFDFWSFYFSHFSKILLWPFQEGYSRCDEPTSHPNRQCMVSILELIVSSYIIKFMNYWLFTFHLFFFFNLIKILFSEFSQVKKKKEVWSLVWPMYLFELSTIMIEQ
jgi:hypothetical protein